MWKPFIYQHLVGGGFFLVGIIVYYLKTTKEYRKLEGKAPVIYALLAFAFYFTATLIWQLLAIRSA